MRTVLAMMTLLGVVISFPSLAQYDAQQVARESMARAQAEKARNDAIVEQQREREQQRREQERRVRAIEEAQRRGRTG